MTQETEPSVYSESVKREISKICLVSPKDCFRKIVSCDRIRPDARIALWEFVDIDDYSKSRFFVVPLQESPENIAIYEVDFLSRHEILPPLKIDNIPPQWSEWGIARGFNMMVFDREVFMKNILTPDMFIALPKHRFETLADDVCSLVESSGNPVQGVFDVLSGRSSGYSFLLYIKPGISYDACTLYVMHSCLEGRKYENSYMCRPALEQLQLRTC